MIEQQSLLVCLEAMTIFACSFAILTGLIASQLAYKLNKENNIYYAITFMSLVYIYINFQYSAGTQIESDVSIMYRMFHLAIVVIFNYMAIAKIKECLMVLISARQSTSRTRG